MPEQDDLKYLNDFYKDPVLARQFAASLGLKSLLEDKTSRSPFVQYAVGVAEGKYVDDKILSGLIQSMVMKLERERSGKGMQNFKWPSEYDHLLHLIEIESPRAYKILSQYLPGRSQRSFAQLRAKEPHIPMTITDETFILVRDRLRAAGYYGPVALSCDDTKLDSSWRVCEGKDKSVFLVGAIGGPIAVPTGNAAEVQDIIDKHSNDLATKVRLFTVQVPLPGVAPILVSALPIGESNDAEVLVEYSEAIIRGLISHGVRVSSYSCDGTETERKVERLLCKRADDCVTYTIPSPHNASFTITLTIALFSGCPVIMLQDSKHGLKTFRNNLFSGARLLVLGNATALYRHIRELAFHPSSPLYQRDVEKLDRQDDNAATRLFSSHALEHLSHHFPDFIGEVIYLFIFGELIDAYQNRHISLFERLKLVLRAHYFLCMWKTFLQTAGYPQSRYFISREAADIAQILIEGLLALIFVYRDFYTSDSECHPLLPWLHSTEPCEHVFGSARQIVKDFTMLDFYYMAQKLHVKIRETTTLAQSADPRTRATGYNHTYFDTRDMDLSMLSTFPSDEDLPSITMAAMEEAESIIGFLGLAPSCLHEFMITASPFDSVPRNVDLLDELEDVNDETPDFYNEDYPEGPSASAELRDLLQSPFVVEASVHTGFTQKECSRLTSISSAAAALMIEDRVKVDELLEVNTEMEDEALADECDAIRHALTAPKCTPAKVSVEEFDIELLVKYRKQHETRQAAEGVRTQATKSTPSNEVSSRRQLIKEIHQVLKAVDTRRIGTGLERNARWKGDVHVGPPLTGNAANAKVVADATSKTNLTKRTEYFTQAKIPELGYVNTARVSAVNPLRVGSYGMFYYANESRVAIGKVLAMYKKGGGQNGKLGSIEEASSIGGISYIGLKVYQRSAGSRFREQVTRLNTTRFDFVPALHFLSVFGTSPTPDHAGVLSLSDANIDLTLYRTLDNAASRVTEAIELSRRRKKKIVPNL
ncbi:hypothetical protein QCA50_012363 [Cerrena zonata]|uniref:Uncharacterized protein n=1 Tax=Cerrena zonata TaxID=2478898 RepID=A0AAW0FU83_9APHY